MTVLPSHQALTAPFLVQFIRFHRGAPEVTRTLSLNAANSTTVLERAKTLTGRGSWPVRTDALRVMDQGGRTLIKWDVPPSTIAPTTILHADGATNRGAQDDVVITMNSPAASDRAISRWEDEGGALAPKAVSVRPALRRAPTIAMQTRRGSVSRNGGLQPGSDVKDSTSTKQKRL